MLGRRSSRVIKGVSKAPRVHKKQDSSKKLSKAGMNQAVASTSASLKPTKPPPDTSLPLNTTSPLTSTPAPISTLPLNTTSPLTSTSAPIATLPLNTTSPLTSTPAPLATLPLNTTSPLTSTPAPLATLPLNTTSPLTSTPAPIATLPLASTSTTSSRLPLLGHSFSIQDLVVLKKLLDCFKTLTDKAEHTELASAAGKALLSLDSTISTQRDSINRIKDVLGCSPSEQNSHHSPDQARSYSAVATSPPPPSHELRVFPKTKLPGNVAATTKALLNAEISPQNLKIGINYTKSLPGGMVINCRSANDVSILKSAIDNAPSLIAKERKKVDPTFSLVIPGIPSSHDAAKVLKALEDQNNNLLHSGGLAVKGFRPTRRNANTIVFVQTTPVVYQALSKCKFQLHYELLKLTLRERVNMTQCFGCHKFGHPLKYCNKRDDIAARKCITCAQNHGPLIDCTNQPKCCNCVDFNKATKRTIDVNHPANHPECPQRLKALHQARLSTNYGQ